MSLGSYQRNLGFLWTLVKKKRVSQLLPEAENVTTIFWHVFGPLMKETCFATS